MVPARIVTVSNDGAWLEEIKIEMRNTYGENFTGSVTKTEAKPGIYRDCLEFTDFKNFDGVRFSYKGIRIVINHTNQSLILNECLKDNFR